MQQKKEKDPAIEDRQNGTDRCWQLDLLNAQRLGKKKTDRTSRQTQAGIVHSAPAMGWNLHEGTQV